MAAVQIAPVFLDQHATIEKARGYAVAAALAHKFGVIGVNERVTEASGASLYDALWFLDSEGTLVGRHRKLIPSRLCAGSELSEPVRRPDSDRVPTFGGVARAVGCVRCAGSRGEGARGRAAGPGLPPGGVGRNQSERHASDERRVLLSADSRSISSVGRMIVAR